MPLLAFGCVQVKFRRLDHLAEHLICEDLATTTGLPGAEVRVLVGAQDLLAGASALHETRVIAFHCDFLCLVLIVDRLIVGLELPGPVVLAFGCARQSLDATTSGEERSLGQSRVLNFQILFRFGCGPIEVAGSWRRYGLHRLLQHVTAFVFIFEVI